MASETKLQKPNSSVPYLGSAFVLPLLIFGLYQSPLASNPFNWSYGNLETPIFTAHENSNTSSFEQMGIAYSKACPDHAYRTHIFSTNPLIIYVEEYLKKDEIDYLLQLADPLYRQSPVSKGHDLETYDAEVRSSMSAVVTDDPVVECIERRSVEFQGFLPVMHLEDIQVVKYGISDHFRPHYDWFEGMENPRLSTFFVYIACDDIAGGECEGGATQFPHYEGSFPAKWCAFINCEDESDVGGIAFKPIVDNAVFWGNLYPDGTGHSGVWHAGMPVTKGRKVGLNIFTRKYPLA